MSRIDDLLALSIKPLSVRQAGAYTIPRSYGVYRLEKGAGTGRRFRFGNHPVRQHELIREYGGAVLEALFLKREHAAELAALRNDATKG